MLNLFSWSVHKILKGCGKWKWCFLFQWCSTGCSVVRCDRYNHVVCTMDLLIDLAHKNNSEFDFLFFFALIGGWKIIGRLIDQCNDITSICFRSDWTQVTQTKCLARVIPRKVYRHPWWTVRGKCFARNSSRWLLKEIYRNWITCLFSKCLLAYKTLINERHCE